MASLRALSGAAKSHLKEFLQTLSSRSVLPVERRDDDLFLVEFPKSGVTWLTFLVANVNVVLNETPRSVTFFNINDFVPDVHSFRYLSDTAPRYPGHRIIKSHAEYVAQYRKVFYLIRDPRHVMVSYWVFQRELGFWNSGLEEFVKHPKHGIKAWNDHVNGWLNRIDSASSFSIIRYEDLVANAAGELQRMYRLLGINLTNEVAIEAVERSRIERMRKLEAEFVQGHPALQKLRFVRPTAVGGEREPMSTEVRKYIEREAKPLLVRLGYMRDVGA